MCMHGTTAAASALASSELENGKTVQIAISVFLLAWVRANFCRYIICRKEVFRVPAAINDAADGIADQFEPSDQPSSLSVCSGAVSRPCTKECILSRGYVLTGESTNCLS